MIEKILLTFLIFKGCLIWDMENQEVGVSLVFGQRKGPKWTWAGLGRLCMGVVCLGLPVLSHLHCIHP